MSRFKRFLKLLVAISVIVLISISAIHLYSPQRVENWTASFNIHNEDKMLQNLPAILQRAHEYTRSKLKLSTFTTARNSYGINDDITDESTVTDATSTSIDTMKTTMSSKPLVEENNKYSLQIKKYREQQQITKKPIIIEPKGWAYAGPDNIRCKVRTIGCFLPSKTEIAVKAFVYSADDMTDWKCIDLCSKRAVEDSFMFAGLRNGNECQCGLNARYIVSLEGSNKCHKPCAGDKTRKCGGSKDVTMLYDILSKCDKAPPLQDLVDDKSFLGCYPKPNLPSIMEEYIVEEDWTAASCLLRCERVGLVLAVPVYPNLCYCGLTTDSFDLSNPTNFTMCTTTFTQYVMVYRTNAEDARCSRKRFLKQGEWENKVGLITFPGSGNTWLRHLIESATGVFTGSVYADLRLQNGGFMGELVNASSYKVGVIKSHVQYHAVTKEYLNSVINVFRNPYNAVLSEFNRRKKGHTGTISTSKFNHQAFNELTTGPYMQKWKATTEVAISAPRRKLVFSYEDLVNNTLYYTEKMARFILGKSVDEKDLHARLLCLRLQSTGQFKRTKKSTDFDPFTREAKLHINEQINILSEKYRKAGYGEFPDYRRPV